MELKTKQNICRACLTEEGSFQSVFVKRSSSGVSMNISQMLSACATIRVYEGDGLPDQICSECSDQTVKIYLFKLRCEKSDITLRKSLEKRKAKSVAEFKCKIDEETWEKSDEKISYQALKEEIEIKEFVGDIYRENVNQDDLFISHEIIRDIKLEEHEIIDENIEIKYNSISPLLTESKESLFPCSECDSIFYEEENLDEHIGDLHIKKEPELSCDENLKKKRQLAEINLHLKNNPHGCDICFEGFSQTSELKKHMKTHTTSTSTQSGKQPSISDVVCDKELLKSYECDICEKKFTVSSNFRRHRKIHTGKKPFQCEVCNMKFTECYLLKSHKLIHTGEKPYECEVCKKRFKRLFHLTRHKRIHTGEKLFECEMCKKKFTEFTGLNCHKILHTGEKPYECNLCRKRFAQLGNLNCHKKIHTGEKPYKCDVCNKGFNKSQHLTRHKRTHTGEKPYECDVCKKKFSHSHTLVSHKRIHTGEKPFKSKYARKDLDIRQIL